MTLVFKRLAPFARAISLVLGVTVMLLGSIFPFILAKQATALNQSIFLVVMAGMAGALIHGSGFTPLPGMLRWLAAPAFTWGAMILGLGAMVYLR